MEEEIEIPQYFLCPISLQIMKDPVTAITGITYDRDSIEQWLTNSTDSVSTLVCPVSKQPLPRNSDLTPNHTLRRLIQAWCTLNAVDRIPTPKAPLHKSHLTKLLRDSQSSLHALAKLDALASENDGRNRASIADAGSAKAMLSLIVTRHNERRTEGVEQALRISNLTWSHTPEPTVKGLIREKEGPLIASLTWIITLNIGSVQYTETAAQAMSLLNRVVRFASAGYLERSLDLEFFRMVVRQIGVKRTRRSALQILIEACPWGANRGKMVEANAVEELIEMELDHDKSYNNSNSKHTTELGFDLLARLCTCADGRERLLGHAAGMAVVGKRTLRVSAATDDRTVHIMGMMAKLREGKEEMLRVGAVSKLCMVIQADCAAYLKDKARKILKEHSHFWNNSPCIALYLLTWYPR